MFPSARLRQSIIAGLVLLALMTGATNTAADDGAVLAALSDSHDILSRQKAKSIGNAKHQLGLVSARIGNTRGIRLEGGNLNASTLAMRFSGDTAENSATFQTKRLLAPKKERRTRRTAIWVGGNVILDSARAEKAQFATVYTDGLAFGIDTRLGSRLLLGNAIGMSFDRTGVGADGSLETRYFSNTLYGSLTTSPDTYLDVAVGASRGFFLSEQEGWDFFKAGDRPASQAFGLTRYSRLFQHDRLRLRSYGQARYLWTHFDSHHAKGGAYFSPYSTQALELTFGLRGETSAHTRLGKVKPHAVLEVSQTLKTSDPVVASFESIQDITAPSADRFGSFSARTGLKWTITSSASVDGEYALSSAIDEFTARQKVTARFKLAF